MSGAPLVRVHRPLAVPADAAVDPRIGSHGPALLALEDGTVFAGIAFGAPVASGGDIVVNTSQTGYQEVCTDPSYAGQVVVMTYPLIGNHGRVRDDDQSERPWLRGLVVGHATAAVMGKARQIIHLLRSNGVPAIAVNGRFVTAPSIVGSHEGCLQVVDYLIGQERRNRRV